MVNPLIDDQDAEFLLYDVVRADRLLRLGAFAEHSRETFDMYLGSTRRFAREVLYPAYKPMDLEKPVLEDGQVHVHPRMKEIYPAMTELGMLAATRPEEVGGVQLPLTVSTLREHPLSVEIITNPSHRWKNINQSTVAAKWG